jgi:hypothetical protein
MPRRKGKRKPISRCPKCKRWLPQRNAVHVCAPQVPLSHHFRGKNPIAQELFRALRAAVNRIGRVQMDSTKTRIAFRVWTNFLEVTPQKNALKGCLTLPRAVRHPLFHRVASLSPRIHYHYFKLTDRKQLDARFRRLLREAFVIGRRQHLKPPMPRRKPHPAAPAVKARRSTAAPQRPLWTCPKCGWQFVTRNLWHSCASVPLADHFKGKDPIVRKAFNALLAALRKNGPLTVVTSKTRIALMTRIRFLALTPQKKTLAGGFALMHPVRHPLLRPGLRYGDLYGYSFRLSDPAQIDDRFRKLLAEAYAIGQQKHLARQ